MRSAIKVCIIMLIYSCGYSISLLVSLLHILSLSDYDYLLVAMLLVLLLLQFSRIGSCNANSNTTSITNMNN